MQRVTCGLLLVLGLVGVTAAWAGDATTTVQFSWDPLPGAARYEIQVARDRAFTRDVRTEVVEGSRWKTELVDTTYYWRVRGIDSDGLPGVFSAARRVEEKQRIRPTPMPTREGTPVPATGTPTPIAVATPKPSPTPRLEPTAAPAVTPTVPLWDRVPGSIGLRVGGYSNFGQVTTPRLELELASRLGRDSPWIVALRPGYFTSGQTVNDGSRQARSQLHAFPVQLTGRYLYSWQGFDWYGGAGAMLTYLNASVEIPTQPRFQQSGSEFGGLAFIGVERRVGPGRLSLEVDYLVSTRMSGFVLMDPGGLVLSAGYRFEGSEL